MVAKENKIREHWSRVLQCKKSTYTPQLTLTYTPNQEINPHPRKQLRIKDLATSSKKKKKADARELGLGEEIQTLLNYFLFIAVYQQAGLLQILYFVHPGVCENVCVCVRVLCVCVPVCVYRHVDTQNMHKKVAIKKIIKNSDWVNKWMNEIGRIG